MKLFRWTLATIVAVGLVFVAGGLLLPSTTHVERSVVIERSPEQVFATLDSFERFNAWSPWAEYDPQARYTFDGPARHSLLPVMVGGTRDLHNAIALNSLVMNLGRFAGPAIAGVLLVFAVLVLLYKRLMSPLVNMTSLALAPLGGILLIWLLGQPQSMPVYIGILLLLGIVSKNSILLIDFAIEEMNKGVGKLDAIMDAGHKRAQPIVMTTVAMTAGMVPVALSLSGDGAWRQPMGIVVIGGLVLSTLLTLLIVPAGFSLADSFEKRVGPWLRARMLTYKPGDENSFDGAQDRPFPGLAKLSPPGGEPAE